jgi:hypothetical protein
MLRVLDCDWVVVGAAVSPGVRISVNGARSGEPAGL